ncbi:hypothetical protein RF11_15626 [Thelohanellus kitauei]|uniref:Uncharacterized protein n=1 Tax=Thelohanellus kitauei TaxID=669202 RepID=A0A0C2J7Y7_THEKT|nr:hypothetical protein RF11_15626 [Thelohanellus kitauei]
MVYDFKLVTFIDIDIEYSHLVSAVNSEFQLEEDETVDTRITVVKSLITLKDLTIIQTLAHDTLVIPDLVKLRLARTCVLKIPSSNFEDEMSTPLWKTPTCVYFSELTSGHTIMEADV